MAAYNVASSNGISEENTTKVAWSSVKNSYQLTSKINRVIGYQKKILKIIAKLLLAPIPIPILAIL
ncbi:MAG: hypothetical protein AAF383_31625 [Cyanobacteria bacterium P01_A01_bin.83]